MAIKTYRPTTPSRRHMSVSGFDGVARHVKPEKSLTEVLKKNSGRTSRARSSASSTTPTAARISLSSSTPTPSAATFSPPWA